MDRRMPFHSSVTAEASADLRPTPSKPRIDVSERAAISPALGQGEVPGAHDL